MIPVILSAGRGSRIGAETETLPKWFLEIGSKRLYEYQLSALSTHFDESYVILGHGFENQQRYPENYINSPEGINVKPLVFQQWNQTENAATAEFAVSNIPAHEDLLLVCGDTIFSERLLRNLILSYNNGIKDRGNSAVAMFEGVQDQKTSIRYDDERKVTDYGAIKGHEEAGLFILNGNHIQRAKEIWRNNRHEWFPIVFPKVTAEAIEVNRGNHMEINTREDLTKARSECQKSGFMIKPEV